MVARARTFHAASGWRCSAAFFGLALSILTGIATGMGCDPGSIAGGMSTGGAPTGGSSSGDGSGGTSSAGGGPSRCDYTWLDNTWRDNGKCNYTVSPAVLRTANILILLDKSASMAPPVGSVDQWTPVKQALQTAFAKVPSFNVGLDLFPTQTVWSGCVQTSMANTCCVMPKPADPLLVDLTNALDALPDITYQLDLTAPGGGTPTYAALERALHYFTSGRGTDLVGDKYVLLVTDGGPNCRSDLTTDCDATACTYNLDGLCSTESCCTGAQGRSGCLDDERVVAKLTELNTAGITTFVIGLPGSAVYAEELNQFADAGGHPLVGESRYYRVDDLGALDQTLEDITINLVTDCRVVLEHPPPNLDVLLIMDCTQVVAKEDILADLSSYVLQVVGSSCETMKRGVRRLEYLPGCE